MNYTPVGGEFKMNHDTPCLTDGQRQEIKAMIRENIGQLKKESKLLFRQSEQNHVLFSWPVQKANGVVYNDIWGVSNYVDQNPNLNQVSDYNCGTKTYDNHRGVDIFLWPFSWKQVDNSEAKIVAAAPGQIISKHDGEFDRSCQFNNNIWNAVYVQHTDGSVALYGHMKNGSVTTKNVGDSVAEGEYLGYVGSSGNSTGPHLHFEVYSEIEWNGEGQDVLVDPYSGSCNSLNTDSWWQTQKPYKNTNINAVLTHNLSPVFPTCPQTETTNESNQFSPGQMVYFAVYLRDQIAGTSLNLKIIRPDNTVFENWNYNLTQNYDSSYWIWNNNAFTIEGEWKWQVTYQGQTVTHSFNIGTMGVDENKWNIVSVYPNPFNDVINIESESNVRKVTVSDMLGKTIEIVENPSDGIKNINLQNISNGIYFLILETDSDHRQTVKIIKD